MEPIGIASGVGRSVGAAMAKAALAQSGRARLGSRDERRAVYRHFQSCVIAAFETRQRCTRWRRQARMGIASRAMLAAVDRANEALMVMQDALADLMLVGSYKPRQAAIRTALAIQDIDVTRRVDSRENEEGAKKFWDQLEVYLQACQEDLWYLPPWWQVWRSQWWAARWKVLRRRKGSMDGQSPEPPCICTMTGRLTIGGRSSGPSK